MNDGPELSIDGVDRWRIESGTEAARVVEIVADGALDGMEFSVGSGPAADIAEVRRWAESGERRWREAVGSSLGPEELRNAISAARDLQFCAVAAATALAVVADPREHEAVSLSDRFASFLLRATRALSATIVPEPDGRFRLRWTEGDRRMIAGFAAEVDGLLTTDDAQVARLFPPAYGDDDERNQGYAALARSELIDARRASLATLTDALGREVVGIEELHPLMRAVNDLRLVLGTRLDVSEDEPRRRRSGKDAAQWAAYERLTHILGDIVACLDGS